MKNNTILRYKTDKQGTAVMPGDAVVTKVTPSSQQGHLNVWAIADKDAPKIKRHFGLLKTGVEVKGEIKYVIESGATIMPDGIHCVELTQEQGQVLLVETMATTAPGVTEDDINQAMEGLDNE